MSSDRARKTYDPAQQYRSVVIQQGRVTLEADWNEAQEIFGETLRADALDIIGPAGTPDNGYAVSFSSSPTVPPFDFQVGPGTMYVGGERVFLPAGITYFQQAEWLDGPNPVTPTPPKNEFVYLLLREQEVSAVEDPDLREVALGGPDTAQRTRIVQRVVRQATEAADCASALAETKAQWAAEGRLFDEATMQLRSQARLQVSLPSQSTLPDPCLPGAQGGYLGAENQLIRVMITGYDPNSQQVTFVWGLDNASFLYRVEIAPDAQTLTLKARPVDAFHAPQANQAVEVLRAAVQLSNGQFVAAPRGFVSLLQGDYATDTQQVVLQDALPQPDYGPAQQTPAGAPFFLRIWQERITASAGQAVPLGHTGLQITLQASGGAPAFGVGDFWMFAVRPRTPQAVYPERYLQAPQPPEGPKVWACPLAVIGWNEETGRLLADCRNSFDNLVELSKRRGSGCCTVTVQPEDAPRLQAILDTFQSSDPARRQVNICFLPGRYALPRSLRLGPQHAHFTLEACHDGVVIAAEAGQETHFLDGLIVLNRADNVTLRGLRFDLPLVPFLKAGGKLANLNTAALTSLLGRLTQDLFVSIGVRPLHCALLTIRDCLFRFAIASEQDTFGVGIFAGSACSGGKVEGNRFVREEDFLQVSERPFRLLVGYLLAPSAAFQNGQRVEAGRVAAGALVPSLLQDGVFTDNRFNGLSAAVLIYAEAGSVAFRANQVRDSHAGIWLFSLRSLAITSFLEEVTTRREALLAAQNLRATLLATILDPVLLIGSALARSYPLPPEFDARHALQVAEQEAHINTDSLATEMQTLFDAALSAFGQETAATDGANAADANIERVRVAERVTSLPRNSLLARFQALHTALSAFEQQALATASKQGLELSLLLADNEIEARVQGAPSGIALLVWDDPKAQGSALILSANRLRSQVESLPTALIVLTERNALTGNLILNETKGGSSLLFFPNAKGTQSAVTGNVLMGSSNLSALKRPLYLNQPPLDDWRFANTEV